MSGGTLVSVIVNNYNYGRYLGDAIASALGQTHPDTEVVVVDDGSTDDSREVIAGFGGRVIPVLKDNGGQASAFNAGFRASRGAVVLFLDADDMLLPTAAAEAAAALRDPGVAKVHWPLWAVDERGHRTGQIIPGHDLPEGDLREKVIRDGPGSNAWPPTSGNACSRDFLQSILPAPETDYRICADAYVFTIAPVWGTVRRIDAPLGLYRVHGKNNYWALDFDRKVECNLAVYERQCQALRSYLSREGIRADLDGWLSTSWWHKVRDVVRDISAIITPRKPFILVDDNHLGTGAVVAGRRRIPFLEKDGMYWGPPADDETAIRELERLRESGAGWAVFAWPAFWWLEHFARFHAHLRSTYRCVEDDRFVAFDLEAGG